MSAMRWLIALCAQVIAAQTTANWTLQNPAASPPTRSDAAMAYDAAHGQTVLFGGGNRLNTWGDTWTWDGTNWTQQLQQNGPGERSGAAMVYDPAHHQVILFAGFGVGGGTRNNDTWAWDGTSWTQLSPATSPPPRQSHAMAYDSLHGQVVMFGGINQTNQYYQDTWVWNGVTWAEMSPSSVPPARAYHAMAYDSAHENVVLFGGSGTGIFNDTWVWNGANWTQEFTGNQPSARYSHAMAFDSVHGQTVLFGGCGPQGSLDDTWLWNGGNWSEASPQASPSVRCGQSMAYDSGNDLVVLFGGENQVINEGSAYYGDTWTWSGGPVSAPLAVTSVVDQAAGTANLTPGMPIRITGTGFSASSTVMIGTEAAPVLIVSSNSSTSLIAQVPVDASLGANTLTVSNQGQQSMASNIKLVALNPEIEPAAFYDSSGNAITAMHPAVAGSEIYLLAIGLGATNPAQLTNTVATAQAPATQQVQVSVGSKMVGSKMVGSKMVGSEMVQPDYAGLFVGGTPGFFQVSFKVPEDAAMGNQPVTLLEGGLTSNVQMLTVAPPGATVSAVVNGASFVGGGVVPGEMATAFGSNLTSGTGINLTSGLPLPTSFLSDSLTVDNKDVALFAVDNVNGQEQINFQVPWEVPIGTQVMIAVSNNGMAGASIAAPVLTAQPGIFNYSAGGETFGAILHANFALANTANPAKPSETVLIYCTGLGAVSSPPEDGEPGNGQATLDTPKVMIGGTNAMVSFSGLAPGFVGLYQVNAEVPAGLSASNQPVVITMAGASSNSVLLPVQ